MTYSFLVKVRKNIVTKSVAKNIQGIEGASELKKEDPPKPTTPPKPKERKKGVEGWSDARIRAFKLIDKNPNAYYYRFNAPGVSQNNGKWSPEERELFFKRMEEVGVSGKWGLFSMTIPGRVGYQCSNFYRYN